MTRPVLRAAVHLTAICTVSLSAVLTVAAGLTVLVVVGRVL